VAASSDRLSLGEEEQIEKKKFGRRQLVSIDSCIQRGNANALYYAIEETEELVLNGNYKCLRPKRQGEPRERDGKKSKKTASRKRKAIIFSGPGGE